MMELPSGMPLAVFENNPSTCYMLGADLEITYCNPASAESIGRGSQPIKHKTQRNPPLRKTGMFLVHSPSYPSLAVEIKQENGSMPRG